MMVARHETQSRRPRRLLWALVALAVIGLAPRAADISPGSDWVRGVAVLSLMAMVAAICVGVGTLIDRNQTAPRARRWGLAATAVGALAVVVGFWVVVTFPTGTSLASGANGNGLNFSMTKAEKAREAQALANCEGQARRSGQTSFDCGYAQDFPPVLLRIEQVSARLPLGLVLGIWGAGVALLAWAVVGRQQKLRMHSPPSLV